MILPNNCGIRAHRSRCTGIFANSNRNFCHVKRTIRRKQMVSIRYNGHMQPKHNHKVKYRTDTATRLLSIATMLLAILFTRLRIHGIHVPFALGLLLAASMERLEFSWTAVGILLGSMIGMPSWHSAAAAALYTLVLMMIQLFSKKQGVLLKGLLFLGSSILSLPLAMLYGMEEVPFGLFCVAVSAASAFFLARALRIVKSLKSSKLLVEWDQDILLIGWGLCILACSEFQFGEVSLSIILITFTTMLLTTVRGLYGSFVAALLSASWVIYSKADVRFVAIIALGAALSVPFYREGRIWILLGHFASTLLLIGMQPEEMSFSVIWNTAIASGLLLLLPRTIIQRIETLTAIDRTMERNTRAVIKRAKNRTAAELQEMGALLKEVSDTFRPALGSEQSTVTDWIMQGAVVICTNCPGRDGCWSDLEAMRETIKELAYQLENAQKVVPQEPIPADCPAFEDVCASVLLSYQQALTREAVLSRMGQQNTFTAREFQGAGEAVDRLAIGYRKAFYENREKELTVLKRLLSNGFDVSAVELTAEHGKEQVLVYLNAFDPEDERKLLKTIEVGTGRKMRWIRRSETEDGIALRLEPAPKWTVSMAVSQAALKENESGDSFGEVHASGGRSLFALSDGMGNGKGAQTESQSAIETLFRLYGSGMDRELIFENVNRILLHRSQSETYATLDAVSVDLNAGTAELLKFGTPPSYLLRGTTLYTLTGEALPCGILDDARPTVIPLKFDPDDVLFLCTDGISDALTDELESVLIRNATRQDGADRILHAALDTGHRDDLSVMLLRISK